MFTGGADRAKTNASKDQPPSTACSSRFDLNEGMSYVTPVVNEFRMSKSEFPRSTFGFAIEAGVFNLVENASVEAISIEWENVYDASACNPCDKRRSNLICSAW